jgi:uncharacterized protein (DUF2252 family)
MEGTSEERRDAGRALRKTVPRSSHAHWTRTRKRRDAIGVLEEQAQGRIQELLPIRYWRMAQSPFAFLRGAAAVMAMDLATTPSTGLRVQACGDAHVANFGLFATPERNLVFDVNDFDETLPGPWEWDLKRLAASLHVAAEERGFRAAARDDVVRAAARAYRKRMAEFADMPTLEMWYVRTELADVIAHFPPKYRPTLKRDVKKAQHKDHVRAVAKLTQTIDGGLRFVEDPPLIVHFGSGTAEMDDALTMVGDYRSTLSEERAELFDRFRLVDVARKVVGVGSVGTACWVCLFEGPDHLEGDRMILQVKQAQPSVLEPYAGASAFAHPGQRVVTGQRLTQGASDIFLGWCQSKRSGNQYYVRQLWDTKGQGNVALMDLGKLTLYGALCAEALARAHARTGDAAQIAGYLGGSSSFDEAIVAFAASYAVTNEADHAALVEAIASGRLEARGES